MIGKKGNHQLPTFVWCYMLSFSELCRYMQHFAQLKNAYQMPFAASPRYSVDTRNLAPTPRA